MLLFLPSFCSTISLLLLLCSVVSAHGSDSDTDHADELSCNAAPDQGLYNLTWHIVAAFVILLLSGVGVFGAFFSGRPKSSKKNKILPEAELQVVKFNPLVDLGKHFGTGVILATGFIHMLPGAVENLTNPCAGSFATSYGSWASLFAMLAGLLMHLIEYIAGEKARRNRLIVAVEDGDHAVDPEDGHHHHHPHHEHTHEEHHHKDQHEHEHGRTRASTLKSISLIERPRGDTTVIHAAGSLEDAAVVLAEEDQQHCKLQVGVPVHHHIGHQCHDPTLLMLDTEASYRKRIGTYILELGIATHSLLIGLTLGVTPNPQFVPLFVALIFHQFFEGVALGSRIAEITTSYALFIKALTMASIFTLITPLGVVLGIVIRNSYVGTNVAALITQGILDALSAGILLYMAFVHLIADEITNNPNFHQLSTGKKVASFITLWLGAAAMAIIGYWA